MDAALRPLGYVRNDAEVLKELGWARSEDVGWEDLAKFWGLDPDDKGAMNEATYYTCVKILCETMGKLPLRLMQWESNGGVRTARDHPYYNVLAVRPNPYCTASSFWSRVEYDRINHGNAVVWKQPGRRIGDPPVLWQVPEGEYDIWWDDARRLADVPDIYYRWRHGGRTLVLKSSEVMHFRWFDSADGVSGVPLRQRLKGLIDGALGAQGFQNKLIDSGLTAKAVLQYTASLSDDSVGIFKRSLDQYAKGEFSDGTMNIMPLPIGMSLQPLNMKLSDSQFEELKKYSAYQIAAAFGIKPQQINDMTKQSYASSQAQQEAFYQDTMLYILRTYEDEITWKLLTPDMVQESYFVQADTSVMLRSDFATTVKANKEAIDSGQMFPNEARYRLNLPAVPEGNTLLCNGNMIPVSMVGEQYKRRAGETGDSDDSGNRDGDGEGGDEDGE